MLLKYHMEGVHDNKTWNCEWCDKSFNSRPTMIAHTYAHHLRHPKEAGKCEVCDKELAQASLKVHMETVHGAKRHQCELCEASFTVLQSLRSHHEKVHSNSDSK